MKNQFKEDGGMESESTAPAQEIEARCATVRARVNRLGRLVVNVWRDGGKRSQGGIVNCTRHIQLLF